MLDGGLAHRLGVARQVYRADGDEVLRPEEGADLDLLLQRAPRGLARPAREHRLFLSGQPHRRPAVITTAERSGSVAGGQRWVAGVGSGVRVDRRWRWSQRRTRARTCAGV